MSINQFFQQIPYTPLRYLTTIRGKQIFIKSDYLNHSLIQGNKLRKLKYTLINAAKIQSTLISFGGAHSNHIAALAAAGKQFDIPTVGIIRGEELADPTRWHHTLQQAHANGMQLHFISRQAYREKEHTVRVQTIIQKYENPLLIPEGGSNNLSLLGSAEIIAELSSQRTSIQRLFVACGTGGTLAGMIDGVSEQRLTTQLTGIASIKIPPSDAAKNDSVSQTIRHLSQHHQTVDWQINHDYHFGGYAKQTPLLTAFIEKFNQQFSVPLDPIYTGKLCFAVFDLAKQSNPKALENWVIYHSGGLQGCQ